MANSGPRTNGSQFFFTFSPSTHLDGKHTVFGKLVGGEDTLDRMEAVKVRPGGDNRPVKDIIIQTVQVYVPFLPLDQYWTDEIALRTHLRNTKRNYRLV